MSWEEEQSPRHGGWGRKSQGREGNRANLGGGGAHRPHRASMHIAAPRGLQEPPRHSAGWAVVWDGLAGEQGTPHASTAAGLGTAGPPVLTAQTHTGLLADRRAQQGWGPRGVSSAPDGAAASHMRLRQRRVLASPALRLRPVPRVPVLPHRPRPPPALPQLRSYRW